MLPLHGSTPKGCSCGKPSCSSPGKHPRTAHGLKQASADEAIIREWWKDWPDANVGIATGPASGLLVIDVDGLEGAKSLEALRRTHELPTTLRALTGRTGEDGTRQGFHLYFAYPPGEHLGNSAGKLGKGLDIRAEGGYVVAPPSLHASGLLYQWEDDGAPVAALPAWLLEWLTTAPPRLAIVPSPGVSVPSFEQGSRNSSLLSRGGKMRSGGFSVAAIEAALLEENREHCKPPLSDEEVRTIASNLGRYPLGDGRTKAPARADLLCLADVQAEAVQWLWEPYIPLKMLTILSGDPGAGKTFLAMALAAALTRGEAMLTGEACDPSCVLYLTNENSPSHVLRPRFDTLQGDAKRFFLVQGTMTPDGQPGSITLGDTEALRGAIKMHGARLVVIDPLQSFLGGSVDAHRANQTRPIMDGLIRLADETGCAIVITRHLSKGVGGSALHRGMGSIDFTGAARSKLLVAPNPNDASRIIMAHSKCNLGKFGPSLAYAIEDGGVLRWHGKCDLLAGDLLNAPASAEERSLLDEAVDFVRETLANGPVPAKEVQSKAEEAGIAKATLRRARERLCIDRRPEGFKGRWMLSLPTVAQEPAQLLTPSA